MLSPFNDFNARQSTQDFSLNSHAVALQELCFVGTVALNCLQLRNQNEERQQR